MKPSISVITPSYNQGRFIERTLQSVLNQSVPFEYVVFDGASSDETLDVLRKYENSIRWVSEPDQGQAHAVNKGLQAATGEIIAWLNSDDVYLEGAFERILDFFESNPDVDVVYGKAWYVDADDRINGEYKTEEWNLERLKEVCFICQPAAFFRRRMVEKFGLLDESLQYCMDYEYWLRLALGGARFTYLPEFLASSRLYSENKTMGQKTKVHLEINNMLKQKIGYVPDLWLYGYAHHVVDTMGIDRSKKPSRFFYAVVTQSLRAAWKWNRRITPGMMGLVIKWLSGSYLLR